MVGTAAATSSIVAASVSARSCTSAASAVLKRPGVLAHRVELGEHLRSLVVGVGAEALEDHARSADEDVQAVRGVGDRLGDGGDRRRIGGRRGDEGFGRREEGGDELVDRCQRRLGVGDDGAENGGVDPLHRQLGGHDHADLLDRVELVVEDLDLGSFAGEHAVQRIGREDHDDVDLAVGERSSSRLLVGGEPLGVDEALEHVLVLATASS